MIAEDAGAAKLRREIVLAWANLPVIGQRFVSTLAFFGKLTEVIVGSALVRDVERHQVFELRFGKFPVVFLQSQDGHRENHIRVVRVGEQQLLELQFGFAITLLADQCARQMQLYFARLRMTIDKTLQGSDGFGG
ncbi:MAG: hypothetical protein AW09_002764 [Candidatus Accumulibacter phosphatis]|uniref:Uncharacterized protein n=1 Tax=Candidatus Accumulibacter phosphatis TaxID=327160 RepID=A0A080LU87_9PROT|nr:MAG: hypothetical protein AW09_002764 [Candidatus Accumulibacter phosphatis]